MTQKTNENRVLNISLLSLDNS